MVPRPKLGADSITTSTMVHLKPRCTYPNKDDPSRVLVPTNVIKVIDMNLNGKHKNQNNFLLIN